MRITDTNSLLEQQNNQNSKLQNDLLKNTNSIADKLKESSKSTSLDLEEFGKNDILNPMVLKSTEDLLSDTEKFTKDILDNIMNQFFGEDQNIPLFPQAIPDDVAEMFQNPYDIANNSGVSDGMMVGVHQEYYQKQTFDFNASLSIQTPNSSYEMEISISITQELYISQDTMFNFEEGQSFEPINLFHDKDENPFEGMDSLSFIFDKNDDEDNTLASWMKEMLGLFDSYDEQKEQELEKENSNKFINIYSETFESKYELSSIIDTEQGKAVFLTSSEIYYHKEQLSYQSSSTNSNGEDTLDLLI